MPNYTIEGWPDPDRRVLVFIDAPDALAAAETFRAEHGCDPSVVNGRPVHGRCGGCERLLIGGFDRRGGERLCPGCAGQAQTKQRCFWEAR